jgi:hypothetical protein
MRLEDWLLIVCYIMGLGTGLYVAWTFTMTWANARLAKTTGILSEDYDKLKALFDGATATIESADTEWFNCCDCDKTLADAEGYVCSDCGDVFCDDCYREHRDTGCPEREEAMQ